SPRRGHAWAIRCSPWVPATAPGRITSTSTAKPHCCGRPPPARPSVRPDPSRSATTSSTEYAGGPPPEARGGAHVARAARPPQRGPGRAPDDLGGSVEVVVLEEVDAQRPRPEASTGFSTHRLPVTVSPGSTSS